MSNSCAMACRPSTSTSSTLRPVRASATASAAAAVVLPVPPLPVTTCSRAVGEMPGASAVSGPAPSSAPAGSRSSVQRMGYRWASPQTGSAPGELDRFARRSRYGRHDVRAAAVAPSAPSAPSARLAELGLTLPPVVAPLAAYQPARRSGSFVFTAGQLPMIDGALPHTGKVGAAGVARAGATDLARVAALNGLAAVHALVGLDAVAGRREGRRLRRVRAGRSPAIPRWSTARANCSARCSATPVRTRAPRWASRRCRSTRRSRSS